MGEGKGGRWMGRVLRRGWEVEGERGKAVNSSLNCYRCNQQHHRKEKAWCTPMFIKIIGKY